MKHIHTLCEQNCRVAWCQAVGTHIYH